MVNSNKNDNCKPGEVCYPVEGSFCTECEKCNKFC